MNFRILDEAINRFDEEHEGLSFGLFLAMLAVLLVILLLFVRYLFPYSLIIVGIAPFAVFGLFVRHYYKEIKQEEKEDEEEL